MKSILQSDKRCYITGRTDNLHKHHVFEGTANRRKSEKWGLYIYLTGEFHNLSDKGINFNKELDLEVKRRAQRKFEELHSHDLWMQEFHRNYLEEGDENGIESGTEDQLERV